MKPLNRNSVAIYVEQLLEKNLGENERFAPPFEFELFEKKTVVNLFEKSVKTDLGYKYPTFPPGRCRIYTGTKYDYGPWPKGHIPAGVAVFDEMENTREMFGESISRAFYTYREPKRMAASRIEFGLMSSVVTEWTEINERKCEAIDRFILKEILVSYIFKLYEHLNIKTDPWQPPQEQR